MDWMLFCGKISEILGPWKSIVGFTFDNEKIVYTIASEQYEYTITEYSQLEENVEKYNFNRYAISHKRKYESIVDLADINVRSHFSQFFEDRLLDVKVKNEDENITYSFREASKELVWYIIEDYDISRKVYTRLHSSYIERKYQSLSEKDLFGLLRLIIRLPITVIIESSVSKGEEVLQQHAKSFLFNIAYNFDYVLKLVSNIDDLFPKRTSLNRRRISNFEELMPPQLSYKEELVEQYYMALASEDCFVKFIGFYHIMEHFYEEVYNEDLFNSVQYIIQHPKFSSKRRKDIVKVVELIKKKTKQNKQEFQGTELEALELTLKKYVDISELVNDLNEFSGTIVDYYKNSEVTFSKGDAVDLRDFSNEKLHKKLAARIYKTRNSLVHSKSNENRTNERGIYKPFYNSQELSKEIPLMRFISEAIIINSSKEL